MEKYKKIIEDCLGKGIELYVEENKLKYKSISGNLPDDLLKTLKDNKKEIIDYITGIYNSKNKYDPFPLTTMQSAYLYGRGDLYSYGNTSCHIYQEFVYNNLDKDKVEDIWNTLIKDNDMLKAVIYQENYQKILIKTPKYRILQGNRFALREKLENKIYPLGEWPMFDIGLSVDNNKSILHFSMDFMIADWSSISKLIHDFEDLYFGKTRSNKSSKISFREYKLMEENQKNTLKYKKDQEYWNKRIQSIKPGPDITIRREEINNKNPKFKRLSLNLNKLLWNKFKKNAQFYSITPTAAIFKVYGEVLRKWSSAKEFSLNLTFFNDNNLKGIDNNLIGDFTNTAILAFKNSNLSFNEACKDINKDIFECMDHSSYPGIEILRDLAKENNEKEFLLPYVYTSAIGINQKDFIGKYDYGISQTPQVFIDCQVMDTNVGLQINWDVRDGIFSDSVLKDMFSSFEKTIKKLALLDNVWKEPLKIELPKWQINERVSANNTTKKNPKRTLIDDFLENVKLYSDELIAIDSRGTMTYKDLYRSSILVAENLKHKSIKKGDHIGIFIAHNSNQLVAVLASLLLGAVFIPLSRDLEQEEISKVVNKFNIKYVVSDEDLFIENNLNINKLETSDKLCEKFVVEEIKPEDSAYINLVYDNNKIEGAVFTHKAVVNTIYSVNKKLNLNRFDSLLSLADLNFDLSIFDIFSMLIVGGKVIYPGNSNPEEWHKLISKYSVSLLNTTPSIIDEFILYMENNKKSSISVKNILISNDFTSSKIIKDIVNKFNCEKIIVLSGNKGVAIWSGYFIYKDDDEEIDSISFRPLDNMQFYIFDDNLEDCPIDCVGNLYISGDSLAKNIINDSESVAISVFTDFSKNKVMLLTDSIGRYLNGGGIELLGKKEDLIRFKSNKISLNEVKELLINYNGIRDVIVRINDDNKDTLIDSIIKLDRKQFDDSHINKKLLKDVKASTEILELSNILSEVNYKEIISSRDEVCLHSLINSFIKLDILKSEGDFYRYNSDYSKRIKNKFWWILNIWFKYLERLELIIKIKDNLYKIPKLLSDECIEEKWDSIISNWQERFGDINFMYYLKENTDNLVDILTGKIDPLGILYPEGSQKYIKALYQENLNTKIINLYICKFINEYLKIQKGRVIKILEIGAGSGSTTKEVINALGNANYEYSFTDNKKYFFPPAKKYFSDNENVKIFEYDIDKSPEEQGIDNNSFDIIIGSYVLGNTANLSRNIEFLNKIIAPNGYFVFSEPINDLPWLLVSQVLMMTEPEDNIRKNCFFISENDWVKLINKKDLYSKNNNDLVLKTSELFLMIKQVKQNLTLINKANLIEYINMFLPNDTVRMNISFTEGFKLYDNGIIDTKSNFEIFDNLTSINRDIDINFLNDREVIIYNIFSDLLDEEKIKRNSNFYDYGADSLVIAKAATKLRSYLNLNIPFDVLLRAIINKPTIIGIEEFISKYSELPSEDISFDNDFIYTKFYKSKETSSQKRLRVLVHGNFGDLNSFNNLAKELSEQSNGDILVIEYMDTETYMEIESKDIVPYLADIFTNKIRKLNYEHYQIIGYCFSGLLAIEIARRLSEQGFVIDDLAVIEGGTVPSKKIDELLIEFVFIKAFNIELSDLGFFEYKFMEKLTGDFGKNEITISKALDCLTNDGDRNRLLELNEMSKDNRFKYYYDLISKKNSDFKININSLRDSYNIYVKSANSQMYQPEMYFGDINCYLAKDNQGGYRYIEHYLDSWEEIIIGQFNKHYLPGDHYSIIEDEKNMKILAKYLKCFE